MNIQITPTESIISLLNCLDEGIDYFLLECTKMPRIGNLESDVEVYNLMKFIIRHLESITELGRNDLVLLPSAMVLARTAYEAAIKILWILQPDNQFEREARWLCYLQEDLKFYDKMSAFNYTDSIKLQLKDNHDIIAKFIDDIAQKLSEKNVKTIKLPNMYQMIESLGNKDRYALYILCSQYTHSSHYAANIYCKNLGTKKIIQEDIKESDWANCILLAWFSLWSTGEQFISRVYNKKKSFFPDSFGIKFETMLDKLMKNA